MEDCCIAVDKDVQSYVDHRLKSDANFGKFSAAIKDETRGSLLKKSVGIIQMTSLLLKAVSWS